MPPLRKKGRGGGGGKTEAPLPGEMPGASPSMSSASLARKERERRATPTARATSTTINGSSSSSHHGVETNNLGVFVSRSFQKEKGEKKLLEASRTSLHMTSGSFQRSLRARKAEASSTDSTPRVITTGGSAFSSTSKRDVEREKKGSGQGGSRASSACRGREEPGVGMCRTSCRELGEEKILHRRSLRTSSSSGGAPSEERLVRRAAGVRSRDERSLEYSTRYNSIYPGISSSAAAAAVGRGGARESSSIDGGSGISQRLERERGEIDLTHRMKPSPVSSPAVVVVRKSPRAVPAVASATAAEATAMNGAATINIPTSTATSPVVMLPVKSSCKCGAFRSSDSSPSLMGILGDDRRRGQSPLANAGTATTSTRGEGRERKSRELLIPESQGRMPSSSPSSRTPAGSTPNLLQGRLALLEGRVTQIAAELKATKDLLDDNNPACSKAVLTDIQMKITGIEKAINYKLAKECGLADHWEAEQFKETYFRANGISASVSEGGERHVGSSEGKKKSSSGGKGGGNKFSPVSGEIVPHGHGIYGKVSKTVHNSRALTKSSTPPRDGSSSMTASQHQQLSRMGSFIGGPPGSRVSKDYHHQHHHNNLHGASLLPGMDEQAMYSDGFGGSAPSSHVKPVLDHNEFEERLYPHQKLLRSRPSVHQKLIENRVALHQKLVENSVLLRNKLAALEERDGLNCGALSGDFISSLKHHDYHHEQQSVSGSAERGKAVRGGRRGSEDEEREAVRGGSFPNLHGSNAGFLDYEGAIVAPVSRERRSSRDGRRMSSSRRSFSGLPSDSNSSDLAFLPFEKGSSGTRAERSTRRRSSEKRKSISTSDYYSPEVPISTHNVNQIVMLEPSSKQPQPSSCSPHRATLTVDPVQMGAGPAAAGAVVDLECTETETIPGRSPSPQQEGDDGKELWLANESEKKVVDTGAETSLLSSRLSPGDTGINLECEEILSSGEGTDDLPDYQGRPLQEEGDDGVPDEDEEQAYLGECEDTVPAERIRQLGDKVATAGWFISEGEGILLAHDDASCSFHDASNMECKSKYTSPPNLPSGSWRDCWLIRAAGPDGTLNKYVVAATGSSAADSAFCSWDFYDRRITAFHFKSSPQASPSSFSFKSSSSSSPERLRFSSSKERQKAGGGGSRTFSWYMDSDNANFPKGRTPSGPLSLDLVSGGSGSGTSDMENLDVPLRWYRPCSPLLASACSGLKTVTLYDIRDGDVVMRWDLGKRVASMEFSSPIQWRNKGRLVLAEEQSISVWDVNSLTPRCVNTVSLSGKQMQALYIRNSDADSSGGIRQRVSSRDQGTGDGILCTQDAVNVLDFRVPAGIVLKIPTFGETAHSVSANGDSVFAGVTAVNGVPGSGSVSVQAKVNEWSVKQGRPMTMYKFPESSADQTYQAVTQVWGNSDTVMGVNGNGLFVFDSLKGALPGRDGGQLREVLGTDDLVQPSFDHAGNRVLLISRDRPASWCRCP